MSNTIVIVGAGGFIGLNLISKLIQSDFEVVAIDRKFTNQSVGNIRYVSGDGGDLLLYKDINLNSVSLIYLGGRSRPATSSSDIYAEIECESRDFLRLCEYAGCKGVSKVVFSSSGGTIYGESISEINYESDLERPINFYGYSKLLNEQALRLLSLKYSFQSISLRLANPYGPGQRSKSGQGFVAAAMNSLFVFEPLRIWGDGSIVRDFVYIDDVVSAFISAIQYDGANLIANIGTSVGYSLLDICESINKISSRKIEVIFEPSRGVDVSKNVLSNVVARDIINWAPKVQIDLGLAETYSWWWRNFNGN